MQKESDFIFGLRPVLEAIKSGKQIERLLIKEGLQGILYRELMVAVRENGVNHQFVPGERIDIVTRKNHQGVVAWLALIEYQHIQNLLPGVFENGEDPLLILLDGVSDVRNFGAIVRSADCFGAHAIVIPDKGSARITADAVKTSAGALHNFPVCREKNLTRTAEFLKESGLKLYCADEKSGTPVAEADLRGPVALIMGSEDRGISKDLLSIADGSLKIPISGRIASLNVSVAAGIFLYEVKRQRSS